MYGVMAAALHSKCSALKGVLVQIQVYAQMKFRVRESEDGFFYPQYKYKYLPFWFDFRMDDILVTAFRDLESAMLFLQKQPLKQKQPKFKEIIHEFRST